MEGRRYLGFTIVQIVAAIIAMWCVFTYPAPRDAERIAGLTLFIVGLAGIATARYQLGRSFAIKAEAHRLVTHGLYSKIRNPIYVFGLICVSGFVLVLHKPVLWLLVAAIAAGQTIRARREARVLEAAFGDAYRQYRSKTWF